MTDSKRSGNSSLRCELRGIKPAVIEERYEDHADYVRKISHAARALVGERYLLPEDAERIIEAVKKSGTDLSKGDISSAAARFGRKTRLQKCNLSLFLRNASGPWVKLEAAEAVLTYRHVCARIKEIDEHKFFRMAGEII
jgi:dihydroneopterin aldolase